MPQWYHAEYARSGRSKCKEFRCKRIIEKEELRIGIKQDDELDHQGEDLGWYCFQDSYGACLWKTFRYKSNGNTPITKIKEVKGLSNLNQEDQDKIAKLISGAGSAAASGTATPLGKDTGKKRPASSAEAGAEGATKKRKVVDKAAKGPPKKVVESMQKLSIAELKALLKHNDQVLTGTKPELVERASYGKAFGALPRCPKCAGGKIKYSSAKYICPGYMDDDVFHKCFFSADIVTRNPWKDL